MGLVRYFKTLNSNTLRNYLKTFVFTVYLTRPNCWWRSVFNWQLSTFPNRFQNILQHFHIIGFFLTFQVQISSRDSGKRRKKHGRGSMGRHTLGVDVQWLKKLVTKKEDQKTADDIRFSCILILKIPNKV